MNLFLDRARGGNRSIAHLESVRRAFFVTCSSNLGRSCFQLIPGSRRSGAGVNGSDHVVLGLGERLADGGLQRVVEM